MKPKTIPGADGIPAFFLKNCAKSLCYPLYCIFNQSLSQGIFLSEWKISYLVPIHKSGPKNKIENYRGISKLSAIPKLFENLVKNKLEFITREHISDRQHGFVSGRSTITNLALFSNYVLNSFESKNQVDAIYTDFSKAFDSVDHSTLIHKLKLYGLHSTLLDWLSSYLMGRSQKVIINNTFSRSIQCSSGVPQGSHLGPLLFNIFINDITTVIKYSQYLLYADDLKLFLKINCLHDCKLLQDDLNHVSEWCKLNCLKLNIKKCNAISFYRSYIHISFDYTIDSNVLSCVENIKDLGVILDKNYSFKSHMDYVIGRANSTVGFIKRNCVDFSDPYALLCLYISLVRSILEYADVIWNPGFKTCSDRLEKVQRRFTRFIFYKMKWTSIPDYKARCLFLGIKSLESRRKIHGIMLVRDILCYHVRCPSLLLIVPIYVPSRALRGRKFLFESFHRTSYGINEPICRSIRQFNEVCQFIELSNSRDLFKANLLLLFTF